MLHPQPESCRRSQVNRHEEVARKQRCRNFLDAPRMPTLPEIARKIDDEPLGGADAMTLLPHRAGEFARHTNANQTLQSCG